MDKTVRRNRGARLEPQVRTALFGGDVLVMCLLEAVRLPLSSAPAVAIAAIGESWV